MTRDETCGVFIPEGVVGGKVAEPMGGRVTGRGGWSHNRLWKGGGIHSASAGALALCMLLEPRRRGITQKETYYRYAHVYKPYYSFKECTKPYNEKLNDLYS